MAVTRVQAQEIVTQLYRQYLGRKADPAGQTHWVGALLSGGTKTDVENGLKNSPEFQARRGTPPTTTAEGGKLYQDFVKRTEPLLPNGVTLKSLRDESLKNAPPAKPFPPPLQNELNEAERKGINAMSGEEASDLLRIIRDGILLKIHAHKMGLPAGL